MKWYHHRYMLATNFEWIVEFSHTGQSKYWLLLVLLFNIDSLTLTSDHQSVSVQSCSPFSFGHKTIQDQHTWYGNIEMDFMNKTHKIETKMKLHYSVRIVENLNLIIFHFRCRKQRQWSTDGWCNPCRQHIGSTITQKLRSNSNKT